MWKRITLTFILFLFLISFVSASFMDWLGDQLVDKAAEIYVIDKVIDAITLDLETLQVTYNLYYDLWMDVTGEITTLQNELCEKYQTQYDAQVAYDDAVDVLATHEAWIVTADRAMKIALDDLEGVSPSNPLYELIRDTYEYWAGVKTENENAIPAATQAVSDAQTALNSINGEVSALEFEIRIREPRAEEYDEAMSSLYEAMKPKLEEKAEKEAEIRRIVDEAIQEHIQTQHGENEVPHTHGGP